MHRRCIALPPFFVMNSEAHYKFSFDSFLFQKKRMAAYGETLYSSRPPMALTYQETAPSRYTGWQS